jgi:hypothetical protein
VEETFYLVLESGIDGARELVVERGEEQKAR